MLSLQVVKKAAHRRLRWGRCWLSSAAPGPSRARSSITGQYCIIIIITSTGKKAARRRPRRARFWPSSAAPVSSRARYSIDQWSTSSSSSPAALPQTSSLSLSAVSVTNRVSVSVLISIASKSSLSLSPQGTRHAYAEQYLTSTQIIVIIS